MTSDMLICNKCGRVISVDDLTINEEKHPYGDSYAYEKIADCDCSCGGEYEEAVACDICGEWKCPDDIHGYEHFTCSQCIDDVRECLESRYRTPMIEKISVAMSAWEEADIDSTADAVFEVYNEIKKE